MRSNIPEIELREEAAKDIPSYLRRYRSRNNRNISQENRDSGDGRYGRLYLEWVAAKKVSSNCKRICEEIYRKKITVNQNCDFLEVTNNSKVLSLLTF